MTYQTREEMIELLVAASSRSEKLKGRANREFYEGMDTEMLRNLITILGDEPLPDPLPDGS